MSLLENIVLAAPPLAAQSLVASPFAVSDMHWEWVATNSQRILELTLSHLYQGVVPVAIGALVALPVAYYASRRRDRGSERRIGARTLMHLSSLLYTIPSIALFVLMPLILGTSIISPLNVLVALSVYSFSLMVRSGVDAFDSVPDSVHESARALGYTPRQALMELYLPLATPVIMAGIRVATVANIAMVSVGALIGVPSLGTLFTDGLARNIPSEILAGVVLSLLLALVLDLLLILLTRALTPWQAATVMNRRSPERKA